MKNESKYPQISSMQQDQMLKIITKSFYNELVNYGITKGNIVSISSNFLDCVMRTNEDMGDNGGLYNKELDLNDVKDEWSSHSYLKYNDVSLGRIEQSMYPKIASWLNNPSIANNLFSVLPSSENELKNYFNNDKN